MFGLTDGMLFTSQKRVQHKMKLKLPFLSRKSKKAEGPNIWEKISEISTKLRIQQEKLNRRSQAMSYRGRELFNMVVKAKQEGDTGRANILAGELAQLRKMLGAVMKSQLSLESVVLRLDTVKEFGEIRTVLGPARSAIMGVQGEISGVVPEVSRGLNEIQYTLDDLTVEVGAATGHVVEYGPADSEAAKILKEASEIAAQRMKTILPDIQEGQSYTEYQR